MKNSYTSVMLIVLISSVILSSFGITVTNSMLSGKVIVSIDDSVLRINGTKLAGFIYISMVTPRSLYAYGYPVERSKVIEVSFREAIDDWSQFYSKELYKLRNTGEVPLPTIYVTLFLYDEKGHEYIITYSYSTATHFLKKGMDISRAVSRAIKDPLALFREPIHVVLKRDSKSISITRIDLSKRIEYLKHMLTSKSDGYSYHREFGNRVTRYSCTPMFTEVYWDNLYNSIDNPPHGWIERIRGMVTDDMKRALGLLCILRISKVLL